MKNAALIIAFLAFYATSLSAQWCYGDYTHEIEFYVNNLADTNKTNEALTYNISNWSDWCQTAGCYDIRVCVLNDQGTWINQTVFNASQNYTTETDLQANVALLPTQPVYWQAPAINQPLYLTTLSNNSWLNQSLKIKIYIGKAGVTDWDTQTTIYPTSFCDAAAYGGNWTTTLGGGYANCAFTKTGVLLSNNYLWSGRAGGFMTANVNTSGTDPVWLTLGMTDANNFWQFESHTTVAGNNDIFRTTGGIYTSLASGNGTTPANSTVGFAYYPNGTAPLIAYAQSYTANESYLLARPITQVDNDTSQLGYNIGYNPFTNPSTLRNFCFLYYSGDANTGDPTVYCRTFFDFGVSLPVIGMIDLGNTITLYHPTNTTVNNPVNVTYYATSGVNATFPCTVAIDGLNVYNETHTNATNTSFTTGTFNGSHVINVTCAPTTELQYFASHSGVDIYAYDETNNSAITANLTITNGTSSINTNASHNFSYLYTSIPQGILTITGSNTSYYARSYFVTNDALTYTNLSVYLSPIANALYTRFHIQTTSAAPVSGAIVTISKDILGVKTIIGQQTTDATGIGAFFLQLGTTYYVDVYSSAYGTLNTTVTITTSDYTLTLAGSGPSTNFTTTNPLGIYWQCQPPSSTLTNTTIYFGFNVTSNVTLAYSGWWVYLANGTNITYTNDTTPTGASYNTTWTRSTNSSNVTIIGFWKRPGFTQTNVTCTYYNAVNLTSYNGTLQNAVDYLRDSTAGGASIGLLAIILIAIASAWVVKYGGPSGAAVFTASLLAFATYTGFIPWEIMLLAALGGGSLILLYRGI